MRLPGPENGPNVSFRSFLANAGGKRRTHPIAKHGSGRPGKRVGMGIGRKDPGTVPLGAARALGARLHLGRAVAGGMRGGKMLELAREIVADLDLIAPEIHRLHHR